MKGGKMKEELENALKEIWMSLNETKKDVSVSEFSEDIIRDLISSGYILRKGDKIILTDQGGERARKIIRLHRLAERLLNDVLGMGETHVEESACKFEHVLSDEVEEAICTLLGHPGVCPHGRRIPRGKCCIEGEEEVKRLIFRLSELSPGEEAEVKYIVADDEISSKILAVGLLPGKKIKVIRVFPTFVIQIGNTQFALDRKIADAIYTLRY